MSGRTISVREAQVKTANVEVKSLTITGKQVTLAVFRQLLKEDLIDPDNVKFNGLPWGTVNYFPKPCDKEKEHLHVVWQKGTELRRACVYEYVYNPLRHRSEDGRVYSEQLHNLTHRMEYLATAYVHAATIDPTRHWQPSSYSTEFNRYGTPTDIREYSGVIKEPSGYQRLPELKFVVHDRMGANPLRASLYVGVALARFWQYRADLYTEPAPREEAIGETSWYYHDHNELKVSFKDRSTAREASNSMNAWTHYDYSYEPPSEADRKILSAYNDELVQKIAGERDRFLRLADVEDRGLTAKQIHELLWEAHADVLHFEHLYGEQYKLLLGLDQLFIAV